MIFGWTGLDHYLQNILNSTEFNIISWISHVEISRTKRVIEVYYCPSRRFDVCFS